MAETNATRPSLLLQIRSAENDYAWSQFVDLYAPLIYGFARKHQLQDADAADLTQEVLRTVAKSIRDLNYDPARGTFRGWLFTVVRNKLRDYVTASQRQVQGMGDTESLKRLNEFPDETSDGSASWDAEHERRLFTWAAERVRGEVQETTWLAFWQTAVEGHSGNEVARSLNMSVAAVYLAKSRIMARLRDRIKELGCEMER